MVSYCCCVRTFESTRNSSSWIYVRDVCALGYPGRTVLTVLRDRLVMAVLKPSAIVAVRNAEGCRVRKSGMRDESSRTL